MRFLFWIVVLLLAALLALFAVANRETVALGWWPLPFLVEAPLYLVVLGSLLAGFVVGELAAWLAGHRWRREVSRQRRRIAALEAELLTTQAQLGEPAQLAEPNQSAPVQLAPSRLAARG